MIRSETRSRFSAVLGLLALAYAGAAAAVDGSRPFRTAIEGNANPAPTQDPCILLNTETGSGLALHLGRMEWDSVEVVDFCSNSDGAEVHGEFTITAANGDQIFGSYLTLAHLDFGTNRLTALGHYQITGGTGRFEGATGQGEIQADGSLLPPFEFTGSLVGLISY